MLFCKDLVKPIPSVKRKKIVPLTVKLVCFYFWVTLFIFP